MTVSMSLIGRECPPWTLVTILEGVPSPQGGAPLPPLSLDSHDAGWTSVKCASATEGDRITIATSKAATMRICRPPLPHVDSIEKWDCPVEQSRVVESFESGDGNSGREISRYYANYPD